MSPPPVRTALVLVPAGMNYFYEQHGHRLADALRTLGFAVDVARLGDHPDRRYDWCALSNISEIVLSHGAEAGEEMTGAVTPERERAALAAVARLRDRAALVSACSIDCVATPWYENTARRCAAAGVATVLDFGLHDQSELLGDRDRRAYRFVLNGLTPSERRAVETTPADDPAGRPIPWAFVGHGTPDRAALVDRLVQDFDPRGFVYMPGLRVIAGTGSPHLNEQQYDAVLRRTRYQVWCSHHPHFYMEGERFRMSLLAGSVPVKVVPGRVGLPAGLPFGELVVPAAELTDALRGFDFAAARRAFRDAFLALPSLADGVAAFLAAEGIVPPATAVPHRRAA